MLFQLCLILSYFDQQVILIQTEINCKIKRIEKQIFVGLTPVQFSFDVFFNIDSLMLLPFMKDTVSFQFFVIEFFSHVCLLAILSSKFAFS